MGTKWDGLDAWFQWAEDVADEVFDEVKEYVEKTAYKIEADAKRNTPVDTGRLRASINTDVEQDSKRIEAEIGTDVEYGDDVEYGTSKQAPQPYLIPAFNKNVRKLESDIKDIMEKELG